LYPLEVATAILLVGMIAAIALTLRARKNTKYVQPGSQVKVKSQDRMTVLKMAPTKPAAEPVAAASIGETKA
jgi:NADH-quinone oxidoreductase subunit J